MLNFGWGEWLVILVLVLIIFGPKRLPELARGIGRSLRHLQHGLDEVKEEITKPDPKEKPQPPKSFTQ